MLSVVAAAILCLPSALWANSSVGGAVFGLQGDAVDLHLFVTGAPAQTFSATADGLFQFPDTLPTGAAYEVTVTAHPALPAQTCHVTNRSGVMYGDPISSVQVDCALDTFKVYAQVTGVVGDGLVVTNAASGLPVTDTLLVFEDGFWPFSEALTGTASFNVSIAAEPDQPQQTCVIQNGTGTGTVNDAEVVVSIWCQPPVLHQVTGSVIGLSGQNLKLVNVPNSDFGGVSSGGNVIVFPATLTDGAYYSVEVFEQPSLPSQTCSFASSPQGFAFSDVVLPSLNCITDEFTLSGTLSGLSGNPVAVTLSSAAGTEVVLASAGAVSFATGLTDWTSYSVEVSDTDTHTCEIIAGASGWVNGAHINNLHIECVEIPHDFTVWATISGLAGSGLVLTDNGVGSRNIYGDGTFLISTGLGFGAFYDVTATSQPEHPTQVCTASGAVSGTITDQDITVSYTCVLNEPYRVTGTVAGYDAASNGTSALQLMDHVSGAILVIESSGAVTFPQTMTTGETYDVAVHQQPQGPSQTCTVASGTGTIGTSDGIFSVICQPDLFNLSVLVSNLDPANAVTLAVATATGTVSATVTENGFVSFGNYADLATFETFVMAQPVTVAQTCTVFGGDGQVQAAPVSTIVVDCAWHTFPVRANVSGLSGDGLALRLDGAGSDLLIEANGTFAFADELTGRATYAVTVVNQPTGPAQTCNVVAGSGQLANAATTVSVTCLNDTLHTLSVSVSGLLGDRVVLAEVYSGKITVVEQNSTVTFPGAFTNGEPFSVQVQAQPQDPQQTCVFSNDAINSSGAFVNADVGLTLSCTTNQYAVSTHLSGYNGQGLEITIFGGGGATVVPVAAGSDGFVALGMFADQTTYAVTIATQPELPAQQCEVANASGIVNGAPVSDVSIVCSDRLFYLYANVATISTGEELVLRNGSDDIVVNTVATYKFPTPLTGLASYSITVATQPALQFCVFPAGNAGQLSDSNTTVTVDCSATTAFQFGGSVSGLVASQQPLRLIDNVSGLVVAVDGDGLFDFPLNLTTGNSYNVGVQAQPKNPNQQCSISGGAGTIVSGSVTDIAVSCTPAHYSIGGFVDGLNGSGLTLRLDSDGPISPAATTTLAVGAGHFQVGIFDDHTIYNASVAQAPTSPAQHCDVVNPAGQVSGNHVSDITLNCEDQLFPLRANVSGLNGNGLVLGNVGSANDVLVFADGTWTVAMLNGVSPYSVTVVEQPVDPAQTCVATNNTGTLADAATSVTVTCVDDALYELFVSVSGLSGSGLRLLEGFSGAVTPVSSNSTITFPITLTAGNDVAVSVQQQPSGPSQTCRFNPQGDVASTVVVGDVALNLECETDSFVLGGSVAGLETGNTTTVRFATSQGSTDVVLSANAVFAVSSYVDETTFVASVIAQPGGPAQICEIENPVGQIYGAPVSNVYVNCVLETFPAKVTVSGLAGLGLSLIKDGVDTLAVPTSGTWTFADRVTGLAVYSVAVSQQPVSPAQTCRVDTGMPVVVADTATYVEVSCVDDVLYPLSVQVTGMQGTGLDLVETYSGQLTNVTGDGLHTFSLPFTTGEIVTVQVDTQPFNPAQTCRFGNGTPSTTTVFDDLPLTLNLNCELDLFVIGGTVTGLTGPPLTVTLSTTGGVQPFVLSNNGLFGLTSFPDQTTYLVEIAVQPQVAGQDVQFCDVAKRSGVIFAADVSNVEITCVDLDTDGDGLSNIAELNIYDTDPYDPDTDGDSLTDYAEVITHGTSPITYDTDGDGAWDNAELTGYGAGVTTNPLIVDTDGDGLVDGFETSWNNFFVTGVMDFASANTYTAGLDLNPTDVDTDDGGIWDGAEAIEHPGGTPTDPLVADDDELDSDNDGISDWDEVNVHNTEPFNPDSDHDGLGDYAEIFVHLTDPNVEDSDGDGLLDGEEIFVYNTSPITNDTDGEGLTDFEEVKEYGTNPLDVDTDGDGASDFAEVTGYGAAVSTNPNHPDSDGDGLEDGFETRWNSGGEDGNSDVYVAGVDLNPTDVDSDNGGIWDGAELATSQLRPIATNPLDASDDEADQDQDGISDYDEVNIYFTDPLKPDSDFDELSDSQELFGYGTDPTDPDSDSDQLSDGDEVLVYGTEPTNDDTDADGITDYDEIFTYGTDPLDADSDDDGLSDFAEIFTHITNPNLADSDHDGLSDPYELNANPYSTDPTDVDSDNDGLQDGEEVLTYSTNPLSADSDGDNLSDSQEVLALGTDPNDMDTDNDGLTDDEEVVTYATDPNSSDTDGDFITDYHEIFSTFTDPLNADTDGDDLEDGFETTWNSGLRNGNPNTYVAGLDLDPNEVDSDNGGVMDGKEVLLDLTDPLDISDDEIDSDNDGITDFDEINDLGTDPFTEDQDGDGLDDGTERLIGTNPFEPDTDLDGLTDYEEFKIFKTDPLKTDSDGDTLTDGQEVLEFNTKPLQRDSDLDGITDSDELYLYGTDALNADSDFDGLLDGDEVFVRKTDPLHIDSDRDGLTDTREVFDLGTDPANQDTDGDGLLDGEEVLKYGTDPLQVDTDGDGITDYDEIFADRTDPLVSDRSAGLGSAGGRTSSCSIAPQGSGGSVWALQFILMVGLPVAGYLYRRRRTSNTENAK